MNGPADKMQCKDETQVSLGEVKKQVAYSIAIILHGEPAVYFTVYDEEHLQKTIHKFVANSSEVVIQITKETH